ncbi:MAG: hypothetical protein LBP53_08120 [Candidatus Peribacteria bacterium]|jgi:hypothetical protein|nr:hypothetical protein [Candidatus Peribacteria bacterium]
MQKIKKDEKKVGEHLMEIFLVIVPKLKSQGESIDFSATTEQRKIEICYLLQKFGFKAKSEKYRNAFEIYKDENDNFFIYTVSTNKIKGSNKNIYTFMKDKQSLLFNTLQFMDTVYIGS